jgi:hypothetical protein
MSNLKELIYQHPPLLMILQLFSPHFLFFAFGASHAAFEEAAAESLNGVNPASGSVDETLHICTYVICISAYQRILMLQRPQY